MPEAFSDSLFLPAMVLALKAWLVPKLLGMVLPEGVRPLLLNGFLSTLLLFALSAGGFLALYVWQGIPLERLLVPGWASNLVFFGRLALSSSIIWAPILLLSLSSLPRSWKKVVW